MPRHVAVPEDGAGTCVDEQHLPRAEPSLFNDPTRGEIDHADLARQDHQTVIRAPEPARTEAVPVKDRARHDAVGERQRRGAVPRLGQAGVVSEERAGLLIELGVPLPGRRDQHEQRVGEVASGGGQQLDDVVEHRAVAAARLDDRQEFRGKLRFPRPRPDDVPLQRVDLAVVREHPEGLGEVPGGERVGAVPLVEDGQRRLVGRIHQVEVEAAQLRRCKQSLIDDGSPRERSCVQTQSGRCRLAFD